MREFWKKCAAAGFLVFLCLWIGGIARGYALPDPTPANWQWPSVSIPLSGDEYPSRLQNANNLKQLGLMQTPLPLVWDQPMADQIQVFEKNAQLMAGTTSFDEDVVLIRSALAAHQAVVFNEKASGIAPDQRLSLEIGVNPDRFDALVERLREIAYLESVSVQQRDRTGEFRRLHTQRQSLKKHQDAILKLRGVGKGSIDDALKLEQKIQDIEKELQALSVQLGDLLGKESFYHVFVTLHEYRPGSRMDPAYSFPRRLLHAFLWAVTWWFVVAAAVGVLAGVYVSLLTLRPSLRTGGVSRTMSV